MVITFGACITRNYLFVSVSLHQVVDTGPDLRHHGYSKINICARNRHASHDSILNGPLTLVFQWRHGWLGLCGYTIICIIYQEIKDGNTRMNVKWMRKKALWRLCTHAHTHTYTVYWRIYDGNRTDSPDWRHFRKVTWLMENPRLETRPAYRK